MYTANCSCSGRALSPSDHPDHAPHTLDVTLASLGSALMSLAIHGHTALHGHTRLTRSPPQVLDDLAGSSA